MRKAIWMYLFLFTALWVVFQYVNNVKVYEDQEKRIVKSEERLQKATDSITTLNDALFNEKYFTLDGNDNAYTYFQNDGYEPLAIEKKIEDAVYAKNTTEGNTLIPFEAPGDPYRINKVKVLNHKWLIADFSDGKVWGEMLIEYFVEDENTFTFSTLKSLVYPKD